MNEDAVIIGVALIEKSTIKELAGDNAVAIWLTDIHKDTGVKRYDNSRVYRSVKFDPSLFPELGELDLNTFVGLRFDKELPADADAIIKMKIDMTKVKPVLEFIHAVLAAGDQDMYDVHPELSHQDGGWSREDEDRFALPRPPGCWQGHHF